MSVSYQRRGRIKSLRSRRLFYALLCLLAPTPTVMSLSPTVANADATTPAAAFDLRQWKLTLPVSKDAFRGRGGSGAAEVLPVEKIAQKGPQVPGVAEGFADKAYFYLNPQQQLVFRTPQHGGARTPNTRYVRTELRELYQWQPGQRSSSANWSPGSDQHCLRAQLRVTGYYPQDPQIVVGQIHAQHSKRALVKLQWDGPHKPLRAIVNAHPVHGQPFSLVFPVVGEESFAYAIALEGDKLSIAVNDTRHELVLGQGRLDDGWQAHRYYFKAGSYPQSPADSGAVAEVQFAKLVVTHKPPPQAINCVPSIGTARQ